MINSKQQAFAVLSCLSIEVRIFLLVSIFLEQETCFYSCFGLLSGLEEIKQKTSLIFLSELC